MQNERRAISTPYAWRCPPGRRAGRGGAGRVVLGGGVDRTTRRRARTDNPGTVAGGAAVGGLAARCRCVRVRRAVLLEGAGLLKGAGLLEGAGDQRGVIAGDGGCPRP